jgi:uncharacterized OsmC-like protein
MGSNHPVSTTSKIINGVNVTELFQTVDVIKAAPVAAKFRFRLNNKWIDGGHNRSTINEFQGACADHARPEPFVIDADEPKLLLGQDQAPNPVEYLLKAITACVTSSMIYHAAAKGIQIDELESRVEGDIDLRGFLGIDPSVRNGFQNIRMSFRIRADVTDEQLQELVALGPTFSPVFDSVSKGVPVTVEASRMEGAKSTAA